MNSVFVVGTLGNLWLVNVASVGQGYLIYPCKLLCYELLQ